MSLPAERDKKIRDEKLNILVFAESGWPPVWWVRSHTQETKKRMNQNGKALNASGKLLRGVSTPPTAFLARSFAYLLVLFLLQAYAVAAANFPPFMAEATISQKSFAPNAAQPYRELNYRAYFSYSNSWWRIRLDRLTNDNRIVVSTDCMSVPEGIRHYSIFPGDTNVGSIEAIACPISFPPSGNGALLATWLALCPNPNLPLIDAHRMRRFLSAPECQSEILNHQRNEGHYLLDYIDSQQTFLSQLMITNNGLNWDVDGNVNPYPAPYDKGFLEFNYDVVKTTNVNGIIFPLVGICQGFLPNFSKNRDEATWRSSSFEIEVKRINLTSRGLQDFENSLSNVGSFLAADFRPPALPGGIHVVYEVTGDYWKPTTDPRLKHLTQATVGVSSSSSKVKFGGPSWVVRTVLFIAIICPVVIYTVFNSIKTRKEKS